MAKTRTSFKKGEIHNPHGAPKRSWTWSGELQKAAERKNLDGTPIKQAIAENLIDQALSGNVLATKEVFNRMDGMPKQGVEFEGELKHIIVTEEEDE